MVIEITDVTDVNEERLAIALYTANSWSSDQKGNGNAALSLATTRKIHSEEHRQFLRMELRRNLVYCRSAKRTPDFNPTVEIRRLNALMRFVGMARIGQEWLPYDTYFSISERMYQEGKL